MGSPESAGSGTRTFFVGVRVYLSKKFFGNRGAVIFAKDKVIMAGKEFILKFSQFCLPGRV